MVSSSAENWAPSLKVLHAAITHSQTVASYETYGLLDKLRTYNGRVTARMNEHAMRMETLMKIYEFDEKDSTTAFLFRVQFERACSSNRVSPSNDT